MGSIPVAYHDLFERESFASFATKMPDGTPHVTPVWIDRADRDRGERVLVNTTSGRQKARNVRSDPQVGVLVLDPEDPYRYVSIRGVVDRVTEEGAVEHIDSLARRYFDAEEYPNHVDEDDPRVIVEVEPLRVVTNG